MDTNDGTTSIPASEASQIDSLLDNLLPPVAMAAERGLLTNSQIHKVIAWTGGRCPLTTPIAALFHRDCPERACVRKCLPSHIARSQGSHEPAITGAHPFQLASCDLTHPSLACQVFSLLAPQRTRRGNNLRAGRGRHSLPQDGESDAWLSALPQPT